MFLGGGGFFIIAFIYLMFCSDIKEEPIKPVETEVQDEDEKAETDSRAEEKKQGGKSFKQLK